MQFGSEMRIGMLGLALLVSATACVGQITDPDEQGGSSTGPGKGRTRDGLVCVEGAIEAECGLVRMLNRREYRNTVRDLLGVTPAELDGFPSDPIVGFDNHAASLVASPAFVDKQLEAAEALAAQADLAALAPCPSGDEAACADEFIASFGRRAYRRTPSEAERAILRGVYDSARAAGRSYDQAIRLVIETALQSPQFLYRVEASVTPEGGVVAADAFELASRLSYFLWASMPDDTLLDAAEQGELADAAKLEAEVRRLLADPKARATTTAFHELWLELYALDSVTKASEVIDDFSSLGLAFRAETTEFADWVFWGENGAAERLLVSNVGFLNAELKAHYGLNVAGADGSALEQVDLSGSQRVGLLTQGAFLSLFANPDRTSPTKRGKFVRQQLLCQPPPPPPDNVPALPVSSNKGKPIREMLAAHVEDPACAGCHSLMDPIGFGFESYDAVGRHRELENGVPIDDSGELLEVTSAGPFVGAAELSQKLSESDEYYECVATQWFRFALGRLEGKRDGCSLKAIRERFREAGNSLPELVVAVALSDSFRHKDTVKAP